MAKKMTIVEMYAKVIEKAKDVLSDEEIKFLEERAEMHSKKNANRKPTAQQKENEGIKEEIVKILESYPEGLTITQIMKLHSFEFKSNQQCTALCRQLRLDNIIDRKETKKGTLYFLANEEA